jgi:hypothetical protein
MSYLHAVPEWAGNNIQAGTDLGTSTWPGIPGSLLPVFGREQAYF